jgi:hypothetical protein
LRPLAHSEPYLQETFPGAAPQCISGRTSYLRVRLAFHLYPQLIQYLCTDKWFGPPLGYYPSFTLAMGSSPGFGSNPNDLPNGNALFGLAFATAPQVSLLNLATEIHSPAHSSIGTPSSLRRRTPTACRHAVSGTFNSPPGVLFHLSLTVLLHYRSLEVFSLGKWSSQLPTGFHVSRGTQDRRPDRACPFTYEAVTLFGGPFQGPSAKANLCNYPAVIRFRQPAPYNTHRALVRIPITSR